MLFGEASGPVRPIEVEQLYGRCLSVGAFGLNLQVEPESWLQARRELLEWVEAGSLRLLIHEVLPLGSATEVHRCLEERRSMGKMLLRP